MDMADADTVNAGAPDAAENMETASVGPFEVSDELRPRIDELELWDVVEQMKEEGYAVIRNAAPPELMDELREVIHSLAKLTRPDPARGAVKLLGRHPAVDLVATLPKVMAIAEFSIGKSFRAGRFHGSIKREGGEGLGLHSDQNWIPAPFPEQNLLITFCFACEGMTEEGGATTVVPRSHLLRRHPTQDEVANAKPVAIETEKGDVAVWDGAAWHGSGTRTIPGTRTMLHATYQRLYTQTIDDFSYLLDDEEYMASAPEGMRSLLGADLFFGTSTLTTDIDMEKFARTSAASKL
jgi:hypothetical protein